MLVLIAIASLFFDISVLALTRDTAAIGGIHPISGMLSSLGILLWCTTVAVCIFSAIIIYTIKKTDIFWFLLNSAFLSMYLLFDDLFLFHEELVTMYLGIDENIIFAILGLAVMTYLIQYRLIILKTNFCLLLLALGLLSISVISDIILILFELDQWEYFIEDGFKWLGIACWCSYYTHSSFYFVMDSKKEKTPCAE